ncbi:DUF3667 domain-containing protein [Rhodohalobacter sp. SW132]|uniref:DUF3667 domain-containing protein n=1 Tax=Rhodohalobacter sp. SW132 TaxID=2293433 RepID=UPI00131583E7|nr:DUF3667 domain-containing protein [Rhodohalobacter sp. SW132]
MNTLISTFRSLLTEPRQVIDSFLNDNRGTFMHPFLFCLIGGVIVVLLNTIFVDFSVDPQVDESVADNENLLRLTEWTQIASVRAATQFLPVSMIFVLILSLSVGGLIFLKGKTGGFYDHIVINSYAAGASFFVLPLLIPVWIFSGQSLLDPFLNSTLPAMVAAGIMLWIYRHYFSVDSFMDWIRILSAYITGYVIYVILIGFLSAVVGYMLFAVERLTEISG